MGEAIKGIGTRGPSGDALISESEEFQNRERERPTFREWNDKLLNALAQVKPDYRKAIKNLNEKLETLDGTVPEDE